LRNKKAGGCSAAPAFLLMQNGGKAKGNNHQQSSGGGGQCQFQIGTHHNSLVTQFAWLNNFRTVMGKNLVLSAPAC
jgi:hypothetical protein